MTRAIPIDETRREIVRSQIGSPIAVEASAGTGKTSLLVDRLVRIVESGDGEFGKVVAITFTEKAAAELSERLRGRLEALIASPVGAPNPRIAQALAQFDAARVSTIHAFASSLIRNSPFDLGLDPDFTHLEEVDERGLVDEVLMERLERGESVPWESLVRLFEGGIRLSTVGKLLAQMVQRVDLEVDADAEGAEKSLPAQAERLRADLEAILSHARAHCTDESDRIRSAIESNARAVAVLISKGHSEPETWVSEIGAINLVGGVQKSWGGKEALAASKQAVKELRIERDRWLTANRSIALLRVLEWLKGFLDEVTQQKRQAGFVTFHDQLLLARKLLESDSALQRVRSGMGRLLIDEFQDTDPLQIAIALRLAGLSGSDRYPTRFDLCVVGDPKQSIYRFRGADSRAFTAAIDAIAQAGERVSIQQNFRSVKGIISFVNRFFHPIWPGGDSGAGYLPLEPTPELKNHPGSPPVRIVLPPTGYDPKEANGEEVARAEAAALASLLYHSIMVEGLEVYQRDVNGDLSSRKATWADVAILVPRAARSETLSAEFAKCGIPYSPIKGRGDFNIPVVVNLLNVLRAIDNPADTLSVYGALRSRLFGVAESETASWFTSCGSFDYLNPPEGLSGRALSAAQILAQLHRSSRELPPDLLIDELMSLTDGWLVLGSLAGGGEEIAAVEAIIKLATAFRCEASESLRQFIQRLDQLAETDGKLPTGSSRDSDAVTISTIHSAKGLEFPIVALAGLYSMGEAPQAVKTIRTQDQLFFRMGAEDNRYESPGYMEAETAEEVEKCAEEMRLLYVAMTRARDYLIIPYFTGVRAKSNFTDWIGGFLDSLQPGELVDTLEVVEFRTGVELLPASETSNNFEPTELLLEADQLRQVRLAALERLQDLLPKSRRPSQHQGGVPICIGSGEGIEVGVAVHSYLAQHRGDPGIDETLLRAVCEESSAETETVRAHIKSCLVSDLYQRATRADYFRREVVVNAILDGSLVRGIVDLVFRDELGLHIVDYKTGAFDPLRHPDQVRIYAEAIGKSTGLSVVSGWILTTQDSTAHQVYPSVGN